MIVTAPTSGISPEFNDRCIFLAGGISNCPNWQKEIADRFAGSKCPRNTIIYNPRRDDFDVTNSSMEREQIHWEARALHQCSDIIFWFPKETLCPITLLEFGRYALDSHKTVFVGIEKQYSRASDLFIQAETDRKPLASQRISIGEFNSFNEFLPEASSFITNPLHKIK